MSSPGHEWTKHEREGWSVCSRCGMVRNYDRESEAPPREPVTVGLYEAPSYHHALAAVEKINEILTRVQTWDPEHEAAQLRLWTEEWK